MVECRAEFLIEPFREGEQGPHVKAAIDAVVALGFEPTVGPFGTIIEGEHPHVTAAVEALVSAAAENGATRVSVSLTVGGPPVVSLEGALDQMVARIEEELGGPIAELDRTEKQAAVRMLDERGAFLLRKSIDDVADMMGVSRITIYNYLNAIRTDG